MLDKDSLILVFKLLDTKSLVSLGKTCKTFYQLFKKYFKEFVEEKEGLFYNLCKKNDPIIYYLMKVNKYDVNYALCKSLENEKFFNFFISKGANDWNGCLIRATKLNRIDLVKQFVNRGAKDIYIPLHIANKMGLNDIADFFRDIIFEGFKS